MSLSQRLLVADAHRQFREEEEGRVEDEEHVGEEESLGDKGENASCSGSEAPRSVVRPRRRARRGVRYDRRSVVLWFRVFPTIRSTVVLLFIIRVESLKSSLVFLLKYYVTRGFNRGGTCLASAPPTRM